MSFSSGLLPEGTYQCDFLADEALKFIEHRDREEPFFVYLPLFNSIYTALEGTQLSVDQLALCRCSKMKP